MSFAQAALNLHISAVIQTNLYGDKGMSAWDSLAGFHFSLLPGLLPFPLGHQNSGHAVLTGYGLAGNDQDIGYFLANNHHIDIHTVS